MKKRMLATMISVVALSTNVYAGSYIADGPANVRVGAGLENPVIGLLPYGSEVEVIEWNVGNDWAMVNTMYGTGYIYNPLIGNEEGVDMQLLANQYNSGTNRLIIVDTNNPMTYVFSGSSYEWNLEAVFECSVGKPETPTPTGAYTIQRQRSLINSGETYEYYVSDFDYDDDGVAWCIHSTLFEPGTFNPVDDRVGEHISNGCIRMHLEDAKWIWDVCEVGTRMVII